MPGGIYPGQWNQSETFEDRKEASDRAIALSYGRNPERGAQQLSERVENLLDEAGVVPSDPDRLRAYLVKLTSRAYQAGRNSVNREASRR